MKTYIKVILVLLIPLLLIFIYGISDLKFPDEEYALQKVNFDVLRQEPDTAVCDTDTVRQVEQKVEIDTTRHKVLFFGDSMLEGLGLRMCDYAKENGFEYTSVCWYSSTTEIWARTDTLSYFLDKVKPTFIMICLCGNEQFVRDLDKRAAYIDTMLARIGDIPYIWISPPSWKKDTGINNLIKSKVGRKRYFDSTRLTYTRGRDHIHPTFSSAAVWMDSVAVWMQSQDTQHPVRMKVPTQKYKRVWKGYYLSPYQL